MSYCTRLALGLIAQTLFVWLVFEETDWSGNKRIAWTEEEMFGDVFRWQTQLGVYLSYEACQRVAFHAFLREDS